MKRKLRLSNMVGYLYISPAVAIIGLSWLSTLAFSFYLSFQSWSIVKPEKYFVGLDNYAKLLTDEVFWISVGNTLYFVVLYVPICILLGLGFALLVNERVKMRGSIRLLLFSPQLVSLVIISIVWQFMYDSRIGIINTNLRAFGLPEIPWMSHPDVAMTSVVIMNIWRAVGWYMLILLAALQEIPEQYYDAAKVDGAGRIGRFSYITLPTLRPTLLFVGVMGLIYGFQVFTAPYVLSKGQGGPIYSTMTVTMWIYRNGFRFLEMGYASAMAWVLFLMIFVFVVLAFKILEREL